MTPDVSVKWQDVKQNELALLDNSRPALQFHQRLPQFNTTPKPIKNPDLVADAAAIKIQNWYRKTKVENFAKQHFEVVAANVGNITDADVLCFCDGHGDDDYALRYGYLINSLYSPDDIVLTEGRHRLLTPAAKLKLVPRTAHDQMRFIQKDITFGYWDDPKFRQLPIMSTYENFSKDYKEIQKQDIRPREELDVIYHKYIDVLPIENRENILSLTKNPALSDTKARDLLLALIYNEIQNELIKQCAAYDIPRSRSLCQSIEDEIQANPDQQRRVFLIAGRNHFKPPAWHNGPNKQQAIAETFEYLSDKRYVVLLPKTNSQLPLGFSARIPKFQEN